MGTISSILSRYDFKQFRLGGAHESLQIPGPGIAIIACEREPDNRGHIAYELLDAAEVLNAVGVTRLLTENWVCDGRIVAWVAHVPNEGQRKLDVQDLRMLLVNRTKV